MSPIQGTKRIDTKENINKHDKKYNYIHTSLTAQNDKLQHRDINTPNNKYCAIINHSNSHSLFQQTRQLIYFFSCGTITLNNISLYSHNNQSESSHTQRHTKKSFHCINIHQTKLQQEEAKGNINNNVLTTRNNTNQDILSSTQLSQYISNQSILLRILDSAQTHHSRYITQPRVQSGISFNYLKPNDRNTFSDTKRDIGSEQQHNLTPTPSLLKNKIVLPHLDKYLAHPRQQKPKYIPKSQIQKGGID